MSDEPKKPTQPSMPVQAPTRQIPAMTDRAMLEDLYRLTSGMAKDVKQVRVDQDLLIGTVDALKVDVRDLQRWKIDTEDRQSKHSGGVRQLSATDAKHEAAQSALLATQIDHSAQLEQQTTILNEHTAAIAHNTAETIKVKEEVRAVKTEMGTQTKILITLAEHPLVKKLAVGAVGLLGLVITFLSLRMTQKIETIEHKPAQVQPAPTVYITLPADGGVK